MPSMTSPVSCPMGCHCLSYQVVFSVVTDFSSSALKTMRQIPCPDGLILTYLHYIQAESQVASNMA